MKGDFLSYRVAAARAVLGLVLQGAVTVVMLIYGFMAGDHAATTVAAYSALGLPVWLTLAIVFDQHRRERIEAMEAETLAADAGRASVFERDGGEFRVARSRLTAMYRFLVPGVSVAVGTALIGVGFWRLAGGRQFVHPGELPERTESPLAWSLGVSAVIAFIAFIFARYVSGMAKQPVWQNLRAGAAWIVGTALMSFFIAVADALDLAGPDALARWIGVAFPIAMIVLGCEVFLNFLLDIYRPRKAGETPRPAFDSRVLGFVAAPDKIAESINDAINYQLGFDVSSTWFYQLLSRSLGRLVVLGVGVLWALSCLSVVQPHERAMVLRFGRVVEPDLGPGLHFKLPWPIDQVEVPAYTRRNDRGRIETIGYTATGVRTVDLATSPPAEKTKAILWTNEHASQEVFQIVQPSPADVGRSGPDDAAGKGVDRDVAMISIEIPFEYAVKDVSLFERLAPLEFRDDLIKAVAQREIVRCLSAYNVDEILGGDQPKISRELAQRITEAMASLNRDPVTGVAAGSGIEVLFVGIVDAHPPKEAAPNFERVVQAEQLRQAKIESAQADAIKELTNVVGSLDLANKIVAELAETDRLRDAARRGDKDAAGKAAEQEGKVLALLQQAGGRAAEEIAMARADRWARHMSERGRAARYRGQLASFGASPLVYKSSLYFDALREAMADSRVYIISGNVPNLWINWDLVDKDASANVIDTSRDKIE